MSTVFIIMNFIVISILAEDPITSKSNQISNINPDGSYQFSYQNNDRGLHYHQSAGNPLTKIRGKFGSRNPTNGKIDETEYTAGPRGYRARGPNIHRKQNLSQVPRSPVGSPDDPLADPYDDPSYKFQFKTKSQSRREEADSSGRVQGQYIYVDDVGDKHGVNYKAGANTGFEVENGVPDSSSNVRYNTPLYKSEPTARGRISFERGPDRQYKFLTSSPDQRRAETTGPDGITRGSYSYLDDKGVQRTVEYIAGAGIGYKIVQSTVGPGTHISANSAVPEYSVKAVSNEISVSDDDEELEDNNYHTGPSAPTGSGPSGQGYISSTPSTTLDNTFSTPSPFSSSPRPFSRPNQESVFVTTPSSIGGVDPYGSPATFPSGGPSPLAPSGPESGENDLIYGLLPPKEEDFYSNHFPAPSSTPINNHIIHITPPSVNPTVFYPAPTYLPTAESPLPYPHPHPSPVNNFHPNQHQNNYPQHQEHQQFPQPHPSPSPYPHPSPSPYPHPSSNSYHHPSPSPYPHPSPSPYPHPSPSSYPHPSPSPYPGDGVVKNTSTGWFYGIPPGSALRAHIQNIDLVPTHDRALSPSEALQLDEERDAHNHRRPLSRV